MEKEHWMKYIHLKNRLDNCRRKGEEILKRLLILLSNLLMCRKKSGLELLPKLQKMLINCKKISLIGVVLRKC